MAKEKFTRLALLPLLLAAALMSYMPAGMAQTSSCKVTTAAPTYANNTAAPLSCETDGDLRVVTGGAAGGTSSTYGAAFPATGTAAGFSDGTNMVPGRVETNGELRVGGGVANDAVDTGNPVKVGGVANSAAPTAVTAGDRVNAWSSLTGASIVGGITVTGADANSNSSMLTLANTTNAGSRLMLMAPHVYNGTTWDRTRGDVNGTWVEGNVANAATDAGNPLKVGGVYLTTAPALTNGQRGDMQLSLSGDLLIAARTQGIAQADGLTNTPQIANGITSAGATSANLVTKTYGYLYNGSTWDRVRGDTTGTFVVQVPATTQADTLMHSAIMANTTNATNVKNGPGTVYNISVTNNSATIAYLKMYNASSAPTCGAGTIVARYIIPASTAGAGSNIDIAVGAEYTTGIGYCVTTGIADADTGAVAATSYIVNIVYK